MIGLAFFWRDPSWWDAALGLIVFPAVVFALVSLRAGHSPVPLRAVGPGSHLLNAAVFVALFYFPATAGAALIFYGASMLVAATRRSGGCEITAISNALLDRDDQVGCLLFAQSTAPRPGYIVPPRQAILADDGPDRARFA